MNHHAVFDTEIIGDRWPVFLCCVTILETGEQYPFWQHSDDDRADMISMFSRDDLTFVSFNGWDFDYPLVCAAMTGWTEQQLKHLANSVIDGELRYWMTMKQFNIPSYEFDHIDLMEVAPGDKVSLKRYMGRMGYKTMMDMPVAHDQDLPSEALPTVVKYCFNDCGGTTALFNELREQIELRCRLSDEYGLDLRSKSDAQVAEAILRKRLSITGKQERPIPRFVTYTAPDFIKTDNPHIQALIDRIENERFTVDQKGSPEAPDWMTDDFSLGQGTYKVGIGGLHSTHDLKFYVEATDEVLLSDFDVASYYPNIIMKCGLIPSLGGNRGEKFIEVYRDVYNQRIAAKHSGNKAVANSLKITLNGTYGKLGNKYSAFYSPDLMLAVCLTGQLNLLILIDELEAIQGVKVGSANTDGILVIYSPETRDAVLNVFKVNDEFTGFEYEETPYAKVAMGNVNNYVALGTNGKVKGKGLYAPILDDRGHWNLQKNPTMQVCTNAAIAYIKNGTLPEEFIFNQTDMRDFVSIRDVQGGGVQYDEMVWVDDWYEIEDRQWVRPGWIKKPVNRKSRPKPIEVGIGGIPFGRVARWYMSMLPQPPISYVSSGNRVAKTEGGKLCMDLPDRLPEDLDYGWYIDEAYSILSNLGVSGYLKQKLYAEL